jgi:hypothetical protein
VESQAKFPQGCVLERDVPLLMEKIDELKALTPRQYQHDKKDKYIVEWWHK